ncbi:MAG TPA: hypothetical protein ENG79_00175, partial [Desulfobacteraceae bacterium]|nr:hypothetical protein [Desulfobacteraceae bacterium]
MNYCRYLLYGLLALLVSGCGQTVKESLKVQPQSTVGADKTVVVLPFADYSYADNLETAYRRNLFIMADLTDQLVSNSFHLPVQEDVFRYLVDQKIINVVSYANKQDSVMQSELEDEWSAPMKAELRRYMELSEFRDNNK